MLAVLLMAILGLGQGSELRAQAPGVAYPVVRFTVFAAKPISDLVFSPRPGAAPVKVVFQPTARSTRYEYRGPMPLRFVSASSGAVVAEAAIPAGMGDALLLFAPVERSEGGKGDGPAKYQLAVLDDSVGRHKAGGLAIINLSGLALSGTVNQAAVALKAGLNPTLEVGRTAKISLSTVFKGKTYHSFTGAASLGRNERALLILYPPFYAGGLEVQSRLLIDQPPGTAPVKR